MRSQWFRFSCLPSALRSFVVRLVFSASFSLFQAISASCNLCLLHSPFLCDLSELGVRSPFPLVLQPLAFSLQPLAFPRYAFVRLLVRLQHQKSLVFTELGTLVRVFTPCTCDTLCSPHFLRPMRSLWFRFSCLPSALRSFVVRLVFQRISCSYTLLDPLPICASFIPHSFATFASLV